MRNLEVGAANGEGEMISPLQYDPAIITKRIAKEPRKRNQQKDEKKQPIFFTDINMLNCFYPFIILPSRQGLFGRIGNTIH
jgi:hypothetical protein